MVDAAIWLVLLAARIAASWDGMKGTAADEDAEAGRAAEEAEEALEELMARIDGEVLGGSGGGQMWGGVGQEQERQLGFRDLV